MWMGAPWVASGMERMPVAGAAPHVCGAIPRRHGRLHWDTCGRARVAMLSRHAQCKQLQLPSQHVVATMRQSWMVQTNSRREGAGCMYVCLYGPASCKPSKRCANHIQGPPCMKPALRQRDRPACPFRSNHTQSHACRACVHRTGHRAPLRCPLFPVPTAYAMTLFSAVPTHTMLGCRNPGSQCVR